MRETIQNYFEKTKQYPNYYSNEDFSIICDDIKKEIDEIKRQKAAQNVYGKQFEDIYFLNKQI